MRTIRVMAAFLVIAAAASFFGVVPFQSHDVGKLTVAEVLCLTAENGVTVETEGGLRASGASVTEALSQLERIAPGYFLLATVGCVTASGFRPTSEELLACGLRPATKLYDAPRGLDPAKTAAYLANHEGGVTLGELAECSDALALPQLRCEDGMPYLEGVA